MWAGENQGNFLGRISIRRNQVASMELEDLDLFPKKISDRLSFLSDSSFDTPSSAAGDTLLSIAWIRKLLDGFLCCEAEFKASLLMGRDSSQLLRSPLDKFIPELLDRAVKALDICNAVTHGVDAIRHVQKQAEIVVLALEQRPFTDGQIRRARRALAMVLASVVVDEKEANSGKSTERSWSFGKRGSTTPLKERNLANFRSLSWSVAKNWSAAKQIQAMSSNLTTPRGGEPTGIALTMYIMSVVMVFVMWVLVAAIPCQDRAGLGTHIPVPKQSGWAQAMGGLQEKIAEEWKKKEKKGNAGLMEELVKVERLAVALAEFADNFQFPMEEEKEAEVAAQVAELADVRRRMEEGLGPLQLQIREVFHRIVKSRAVVLEVLDQAAKSGAQNA